MVHSFVTTAVSFGKSWLPHLNLQSGMRMVVGAAEHVPEHASCRRNMSCQYLSRESIACRPIMLPVIKVRFILIVDIAALLTVGTSRQNGRELKIQTSG